MFLLNTANVNVCTNVCEILIFFFSISCVHLWRTGAGGRWSTCAQSRRRRRPHQQTQSRRRRRPRQQTQNRRRRRPCQQTQSRRRRYPPQQTLANANTDTLVRSWCNFVRALFAPKRCQREKMLINTFKIQNEQLKKPLPLQRSEHGLFEKKYW